MKIIEAGHIYELNCIAPDSVVVRPEPIRLVFVNRESMPHAGTQTQEVLRSLIDRTMHCDNCLRWPTNDKIIFHLRMALILHEARALERKAEKGLIEPENIITETDGHFALDFPVKNSDDAEEYKRKREIDE